MADTIMIDGWSCEAIPTDYQYKNLVLVKKGSLTGCYHREQKKLVNGWHGPTDVKCSSIPLSGKTPW